MFHSMLTQAETRELLNERANREGFRVQYFERNPGLRLVHEQTGEGKFLNNETEAFLILEGFAWGYKIGGHDGWLAARDSFAPAPVPPAQEEQEEIDLSFLDDIDLSPETDAIVFLDDDDDLIGFTDRLKARMPEPGTLHIVDGFRPKA